MPCSRPASTEAPGEASAAARARDDTDGSTFVGCPTTPARWPGDLCARSGRRRRSGGHASRSGFVAQPVRIVARGDQQDRGGVGADAVDLEQARCTATHERVERLVETLAVSIEREDTTSERRDRQLRRVGHAVAVHARSQRCCGGSQVVDGHGPELLPELVGCGEAEMADLVQILDAHVATRTARHQQRADRFHVTISGLRDP